MAPTKAQRTLDFPSRRLRSAKKESVEEPIALESKSRFRLANKTPLGLKSPAKSSSSVNRTPTKALNEIVRNSPRKVLSEVIDNALSSPKKKPDAPAESPRKSPRKSLFADENEAPKTPSKSPSDGENH